MGNSTVEDDGTSEGYLEETQAEETVLSLLKSATKSLQSEDNQKRLRSSYVKRLRSFRPPLYFAKPESLSPLVCARFGWVNASIDMLVCEKCNAALAITFHPHLKSIDIRRIADLYQKKLCTAHKVTCCYYSSAFPHSRERITVPSYLAPVLPEEVVDMMEQLEPQHILRRRVQKLLNTYESETISALNLPEREITEFLKGGETPDEFASRICWALGGGTTANERAAALLVLFGWEASEADETPMLHCSICLARVALPIRNDPHEVNDDDDESCPPAKKQRADERPMNLISTHRYYCPFVCGFPSESSSVPVWQTIATNLLQSSMSMNGEEVIVKVHRLLKSGIAPRT